ncbi:MAG: S46 family peptidase [Mangrovibacterium sp.]|nr:S46 family peptidase [Mangrovibacterium sp.]
MKRILFFLFLSTLATFSFAREGMWVPTLLDKYTMEEMRQMGFRLTAEDLYSINRNSMKDAVVLFGSGCTGELVSAGGLLLTNHHCGYGAIQKHSSLEHNYLADGFWARSAEEELPNPGLSVRFLVRMEDVTASVTEGAGDLSDDEKTLKINENIRNIEKNASENNSYEAVVKPLFHGNQYFVYIYQVYKDVRLVGAPPSAIGKFGGDTDNWMWPRHTGDFSIFRVYAGENNEPAEFSPNNRPYRPKSFFPVSLGGVKPDDFILVFGFPGSTDRYLPSYAVDLIMKQSDPDRIKIREQKLRVLDKHMKKDAGVRLQYASKYAGTSNSWKRWQGEVKGLAQMNAVAGKRAFEDGFQKWFNQNDSLRAVYGDVFPQFEKLYAGLAPYDRAHNYYTEIVMLGTDIMSLAASFVRMESVLSGIDGKQTPGFREQLRGKISDYFKNYDQSTDEEVFVQLMRLLKRDLDASFLPPGFHQLMESNQDEALLKKIYRKSVLADQNKLTGLVGKLDKKTIYRLLKDPVIALYSQLLTHYQRNVEVVYRGIRREIEAVQKQYMAGILEMNHGRPVYPDANLTLRVAYGQVEGYHPSDAVRYNHYTTLKGIMQKGDSGTDDYEVPQRLRELHEKRDFGSYSDEDGELPVAFIASVHTTGGNSGSPALNANGELVGINFDRCWEGTMSDIMFDADRCRNIMVDIRYVLFVIDKFAGAGYLLDEMNVVRPR